MRRTPRLLGVLPEPRATHHAVLARSSPRIVGPSAASRRTRAGRGRRTRRNLCCHRNVTGEVSPIKTERLAPPRADTTAHRATRAAASELTSPVLLQCAQPFVTLP
jgi:hypothetical protein